MQNGSSEHSESVWLSVSLFLVGLTNILKWFYLYFTSAHRQVFCRFLEKGSQSRGVRFKGAVHNKFSSRLREIRADGDLWWLILAMLVPFVAAFFRHFCRMR